LCARKRWLVELERESWLVCQDCGRKYPIVDDIPVMLIDEVINGSKPRLKGCRFRLPPVNMTELELLLAELASGSDERAEQAAAIYRPSVPQELMR